MLLSCFQNKNEHGKFSFILKEAAHIGLGDTEKIFCHKTCYNVYGFFLYGNQVAAWEVVQEDGMTELGIGRNACNNL